MTNVPPVKDWTSDWDHLDTRWRENPYPIYDELREKCPIAHTDRYLGAYLPVKYADVRAICADTESFSSKRVVLRNTRIEGAPPSPPITTDPPRHKEQKKLLLPPFTAQAMEELEPQARTICNELIDKFAYAGEVDAAQAYTRHIPVKVIAHMLGVPESDSDLFIRWIHEVLELGITDDSMLMKGLHEMTAYFVGHVAERRKAPKDDLISRLLAARIDGEPLDEENLLGMLRLLLIAGIDTTWSAIGASLWHLAKTPADRERLVAEPELIPTATEEFLRAYAPVTMAREVVQDTEVNGCPIKAGNMMLLSFPAANRDPEMFEEPDKVIIDRAENRHAAFGLGIHRCVGSNLARMEINVALQEWLKRIPKFELCGEVKWSDGTVRGPRQLPIKIG